ncbi:suppressor protein SRP40 [Heracleum sosnowskyi]|uniref:Suppressor protein SRP40 n=1 Tax=Heracleum sosnowskyi TaxID=360622 RepID=A0AAD8NA33_9APIA|nr:suppressor protein SRP40 [Heracleum sosnowskyi]
MTSHSNVAAKQRGKEVEGDDGLKTLECLRGRLLAERAVSRAANEEADKLGYKLNELENKLKEEVKLRKRAEKRLRSLIKKLEAMKIVPVVSDESSSNHSSPLEKSDLSSLSSSSTGSSFSYLDKQKKKPNSPNRNSSNCELDKAVKKDGSTCSEILKHTDVDSGASSENQSFTSSEMINSDKTISEKSDDHSQCTQSNYDEKLDDHRSQSSVEDKENNGENNRDWDETSVDNSMALVAINIPASTKTTTTTIEPLIAGNSGVKDVLDTLRYVKEGLQSSMDRRRHMIRAGY